MGTFVISKRFNDKFKFEFTSRKGKTIFTSNHYELKFECEEGILHLQKWIENCNYLKFKSSRGMFYFKLMIGDEVIATSRKYSTELRLQKSIEEIKRYVATSEILDFSCNNSIFTDI